MTIKTYPQRIYCHKRKHCIIEEKKMNVKNNIDRYKNNCL